jgi:hypothetical protein
MLHDFILIALLLCAYLYWFNGQKVKEIVLKAVRVHCLNLEVQMLDEYVALNSIRLIRYSPGTLRVRRTFLFEFSSTGNERYNGTCIALGRQIESIQMEPYGTEEFR